MGRIFVDVAAVRIQRWLGRSRTLAGRRNASAALATATSSTTVEKLLAGLPGVARNTEAGDVDGVINLEVDTPDRIAPAVQACLTHLRDRLPAIELSAVWGRGEDYLSAYAAEIKPKVRTRQVIIDLPPIADFPPLASCDLCRADAAVAQRRDRDDPNRVVRLCADCLMRADLRDGRAAGPERELVNNLNGLVDDAERIRFAESFTDLAALPVTLNDRTIALSGTGATQLATVYADGNAVGDMMDWAATSRSIDKQSLAERIDQQNLDAVTGAILDVFADIGAYLPVTPHVMAGDDLVLSLPAAAAWPFLRTYLAGYSRGLADLVPGLPAERRPSVSAGIVFAHCSDPFADILTHAVDLLKTAKRAVCGRQASIAWLDLTEDGPQPPPGRPVLTLTDLDDWTPRLHRLAALPQSQRSALATLAGRHPDRLAEHIRRLGLTEVTPFLDPTDNRLGLTDALCLARWYT